MIIFGILILSFSQISNREGVNALNRDLSTQALYAAESGINDTYTTIRNLIDEGQSVPQQITSCTGPSYSGSSVGSAKYTCILVNTSPTSLNYQCPTYCPNNSIVSYLQSVNSTSPITSLNIQWTDSTRSTNSCRADNLFSPSTSWPPCLELLRVDLVPFPPGSTTVSSLENTVKTFFLYPSNVSSSNLNFTTINNGSIYSATCASSSCSSTISGLNTPFDSSGTYYARIQYYYGYPQTITLNGTDPSSNAIAFSDSQIQIDSTGLSGTVLKRVSSYINPLGNGSNAYSLPLPPNYALQSTDTICKSLILDNYYGSLYEIIPPSNLDPYSELNYQLMTTIVPTQNANPQAPQGAGTPTTPAPALTATAPTLIGQTETTNTNPGDSCNPI
ncbi:MAG TPA: hypothetical protein VII94_03050 [Candidatus Saccharimonadales bacterium]